MSEERKPLCKCRRVNPVQVDLNQADEVDRAYILSLLHLGELQAYSIYRFDDQSTSMAFYHPKKHRLILFHNNEMEGASEIDDMFQGLRWWIMEPEIWQQHVMRGER
jgi:hypothetical protein